MPFLLFQQAYIKENLVYALGQFSRRKSQRRMKQLGRTLPFQLRARPIYIICIDEIEEDQMTWQSIQFSEEEVKCQPIRILGQLGELGVRSILLAFCLFALKILLTEVKCILRWSATSL